MYEIVISGTSRFLTKYVDSNLVRELFISKNQDRNTHIICESQGGMKSLKQKHGTKDFQPYWYTSRTFSFQGY